MICHHSLQGAKPLVWQWVRTPPLPFPLPFLRVVALWVETVLCLQADATKHTRATQGKYATFEKGQFSNLTTMAAATICTSIHVPKKGPKTGAKTGIDVLLAAMMLHCLTQYTTPPRAYPATPAATSAFGIHATQRCNSTSATKYPLVNMNHTSPFKKVLDAAGGIG